MEGSKHNRNPDEISQLFAEELEKYTKTLISLILEQGAKPVVREIRQVPVTATPLAILIYPNQLNQLLSSGNTTARRAVAVITRRILMASLRLNNIQYSTLVDVTNTHSCSQ